MIVGKNDEGYNGFGINEIHSHDLNTILDQPPHST